MEISDDSRLDAMGAFGKTSGLCSQVFLSRHQENDP